MWGELGSCLRCGEKIPAGQRVHKCPYRAAKQEEAFKDLVKAVQLYRDSVTDMGKSAAKEIMFSMLKIYEEMYGSGN